jgi:hypothetical protein
MGDEPFRKFRRAPTGTEPPALRPEPRNEDRILAYQLALKLSQQLVVVVELSEGSFARDSLDKRSRTIPQLVAKALTTSEMVRSRGLFENARIFATECEAILETLALVGTIEDEALALACASCREFRDHLTALTVPPKS